MHNLILLRMCCSWDIIKRVALGPSLQLTDHVFVMSSLSNLGKKCKKIALWVMVPF